MAGKLKKPGKPTKLTVKTLQAECDRLRAEVNQLKTERDQYLKSLYALTRKKIEEVSFDPKELSTMVEVDGPAIAKEFDQEEKSYICPKPRAVSSKSAGPRKIARS